MVVMKEVVANHCIVKFGAIWTARLTELLMNIDATNFAEGILI